MAELQPRRYITRARAQAGGDSVAVSTTTKPNTQRTTRSTYAGGRKALTDSTLALENLRSNPDDESSNPAPVIRTTRATAKTIKKPARTRVAANSAGLAVAPRRSGRTAHTKKKVTFASPKASDDKENAVPFELSTTPAKAKPDDLEETDVLMSTSMGALSVKPKRIPRTKLQQPSTGAFAEKIPALSPQKARRPKRTYDLEDEELQDELLCPTSPRLSEKPKRPMASLGKKSAIDGADLLKSSKETSTLFGSPAKRFVPSPTKIKQFTSQLDVEASPSKSSGLSTPARRPKGRGSKLGMPISKSTSKTSSLKFSVTNEIDKSSDTFSDFNNRSLVDVDVFESKPVVERKLFVKGDPSIREVVKKELETNQALISSIEKEKKFFPNLNFPGASGITQAVDLSAPISITPTSKSNHPVIPPIVSMKCHVPERQEVDIIQADYEDISMGGIQESTQSTSAKKHHRSPSEGGSSFGLFDLGDDDDEDMENSENVPPPQGIPVTSLASKFGGIELDRQSRRGFGQEIDLSVEDPNRMSDCGSWVDNIPVDPMLLSDNISDVVISYSESSHKTTVPVKFHCDDDDVFGGDHEIQYNPSNDLFGYALPQSGEESQYIRRSNATFDRSGCVLAGAVVFVDAYTNDGANCGDTFEKMLKCMGAKVIKQWNWNPDSTSPGMVGITHVVFKDGSPRTLQKVRASQGLVACVALKWIIECAQQDEWLDEGAYAIDTSEVSRGGSKRRKPTEPQKMDVLISQLISAPKERRKSPPQTPKRTTYQKPYIPQTEPPKFDLGMTNPLLNERIRMARRQSMQFAPKIGSPLVRSWCPE